MKPNIDYQALFQVAPNAYVVVTSAYDVVDANEAFLRLTNHVREDVVGRNLFDAFPAEPEGSLPNDAAVIRQAIDRAFATGTVQPVPFFRYSIPLDTVEGAGYRDCIWSANHLPLADGEGNVSLVLQHPQNLAALRELLRDAVRATAEKSDTAASTALQDDGLDALGHDDLLRRAESVQSENRDLESERLQLLRLFDQSLSFTVFMREPEHIVELANPAYLKMVGEEDLRDRGYGVGHRGDPPVPVKLLDAVYESGVPIIEHGLALRIPNAEGRIETIYVDVVIQQIVDGAGKVIGVFMQGNDVTMAKATQDELHAYRTRLEEMVAERTRALERSETERRNAEAALHRAQRLEAVGKLTGGVAHDFNNVLQIIRGNLQLLQRSFVGDAKLNDRVEAALDGVDRGAKLSSQLLAFGRRQPLEPIVVDLGSVLGRMEDLLHRALGESIDVRMHVCESLWNALVDVPRLENVILNIAINARDAMNHSGKLTLELQNVVVDELRAKRDEGLTPGDFVTLAISDTGSGMSPEVQRRAFEPFFTTKAEGEGTGLGLSMVYGFMKQSGGHVSLYSEVGQGTTIRLYLPRCQDPLSDVTATPVSTPARGNGETILVVEDDEAVRVTVVDTLTELGYRVLRAADGQSAMTIIQSGVPIDLLFTDVIMPGPVASTDMVRKAHELLPHLRVLFTSGFTRDAIVHRDRLQAGVNLISKPYGREELARKLRQLLDDDASPNGVDPPIAEATAAEETVVTIPAPAAEAARPARRRVLLVEDSDEVRETTIEFINEVDFDVVAVETAEAALETLATERFDVIFTDISLPGMSGIELLKRVRTVDPAQAVVVASGYGADLNRQSFGPAVAVLGKPYDLATLERTLHAVLAESVAARGDTPS
jgi:signal transduction histidine kinase/DNA-binding response OmpR family regulator